LVAALAVPTPTLDTSSAVMMSAADARRMEKYRVTESPPVRPA
jgi:hypothetical protein